MRFFYAPEVHTPLHALDEEEARHVVKVLRASVGDACALTDGKGNVYEGVIAQVDRRSCVVSTRWVRRDAAPERTVQLLVAPTKATERFEWMLEKVMELGVDGIWPILTSRSERSREKPDRWMRILVAALKQSQQTRLPDLHPLMPMGAALDALEGTPGFIAHCLTAQGTAGKPHLIQAAKGSGSAWVAIGPEGDFTPSEIEEAMHRGGREVGLGANRLRTETAGIVAVHSFHLAGL